MGTVLPTTCHRCDIFSKRATGAMTRRLASPTPYLLNCLGQKKVKETLVTKSSCHLYISLSYMMEASHRFHLFSIQFQFINLLISKNSLSKRKNFKGTPQTRVRIHHTKIQAQICCCLYQRICYIFAKILRDILSIVFDFSRKATSHFCSQREIKFSRQTFFI